VDEIEDSKRLSEEEHLPFSILSAREIPVLADFGLEHPGAGPDGETIAVPAQVLVAQDGRVVWKHVARRIPDRASPEETLQALHVLDAGPAR
jgi:peroxiredoxin